jgi:hypothetical protein
MPESIDPGLAAVASAALSPAAQATATLAAAQFAPAPPMRRRPVHNATKALDRRPYRLGDMVKLAGSALYGVDDLYARRYAATIGGRYMLTARAANDFTLLSNVTDDVCGAMRLPHIPAQTVIHLRLGDVLCKPEERARAPLPADAFSARINALLPAHQAKLLISGNHRHACVAQTHEYLRTIARRIPNLITRLDAAHADEDFCKMVNAPTFVAGRGGFSEMALRVRALHNRSSIEDHALSGYVLGGQWSSTDLELERSPHAAGGAWPWRSRLAARLPLLLAAIILPSALSSWVRGGLRGLRAAHECPPRPLNNG